MTLQRFFTIMLMYAFMIFIISPTWKENTITEDKHIKKLIEAFQTFCRKRFPSSKVTALQILHVNAKCERDSKERNA